METLFDSGSGASVVALTTPEEAKALMQVFAAVAEEEGWQPGDQLGAYPDRSVYFALQVGETLVGGL